MRKLLLLAVFLLAAAGALAGGLFWEERNFVAPGPTASERSHSPLAAIAVAELS